MLFNTILFCCSTQASYAVDRKPLTTFQERRLQPTIQTRKAMRKVL
jgi:hypothetical protein